MPGIISSYVECPICKKKLKQISYRHVKTHNINMEEFKNKFPDVNLMCQDVIKKISIVQCFSEIKRVVECLQE